MNRLIRRVVAFIIDMIICTFMIVGLSSLDFLNPLGNKSDDKYREFAVVVEEYEDLMKYYEKAIKDNIITTKEQDKLVDDYKDYKKVFEDIKVDEELDDKDLEDIQEGIYAEYVEMSNHYGYEINKLTRYQAFISIVVYILYFTVLEVLLKGQTIGKKLMRIRIVDNKDANVKIPFYKYLFRVILTCEIILLIVDVVLVINLKESAYLQSNYWLSNIKYICEMAFIICIIVRDDQRSIHDLLFGTKVIRIDKDGNEVEDILFKELNNDEEIKIEDKTNVKKGKKKKEVVEAVKVNDKKRLNKDN